MSNFREMTPQWLQNGCPKKKFKLLKYEHTIYSFEASNLKLKNTNNLAVFDHFGSVKYKIFGAPGASSPGPYQRLALYPLGGGGGGAYNVPRPQLD